MTLALALTGAVLGCNGRGRGDDDDAGADSDGDADVRADRVTLAVDSAREIGGVPMDRGQMAVEVGVTVHNGLAQSIAFGYALFRIQDGGLEYPASPDNATWDSACPADVLLSSEETTSCVVLFAVPQGSEPTGLVFTTPRGTLTERLRFEPCTRCDGACEDLSSSPTNCGACNRAVPGGGSCEEGVPTCPAGRYECNGSCDSMDVECTLASTERDSCTSLCSPLRCSRVEYFYDCGAGTLEVATGLGCEDAPPTTRGCGTFDSQDCRCLP